MGIEIVIAQYLANFSHPNKLKTQQHQLMLKQAQFNKTVS